MLFRTALGGVVASWSQQKKGRRLLITVKPVKKAWHKTKHADETRREASAIAAHLGLEEAAREILD